MISLEEGLARLEEITVDDYSTDWAASELLGAATLAARLGVSVATLDGWRDDGKAVAFRNDADEFVYPARQFDHARPIEGLDQVVKCFPSQEEAWEWLVTPNQYTNGVARSTDCGRSTSKRSSAPRKAHMTSSEIMGNLSRSIAYCVSGCSPQ